MPKKLAWPLREDDTHTHTHREVLMTIAGTNAYLQISYVLDSLVGEFLGQQIEGAQLLAALVQS